MQLSKTCAGARAVNATILSLLALAFAWSLTWLYLRAMVAYGRLEQPTDRGMHTVPVPSGAGAAIVAAAVLLWPLWQKPEAGLDILLLATLAALATVSWLDDRRGLSPVLRLATHAAAVALLLTALGPEHRVLPALPLAAERVALGLAWLWFINLFNFMDGIDGLAGAEAISVAAGYILVVAVADTASPLQLLALVIASATAGYLFWNWHPAKVFMGDTGSIALGFLLGWLMIDLACRGFWAAAVILPLYFVADATLTLARRLAGGERPWQPHRQHFYQRAVLGGTSPSGVVSRSAIANVALIGLALLSIRHPVLALLIAAMVVAGVLGELERLARAPKR
jgi:UDP-N-acetylmuramyl pentapeptide phosphotransferase/UDP-N-acetylglucosamine-1-phosphate transferase